MTLNLIKPDDDSCDDIDVLLRVIEGLLVVLHQLTMNGSLTRLDVAVVNGAAAIADCVRRRHVGS
jgi:hypothetical protein